MRALIPGILICALTGGAAWFLGDFFPLGDVTSSIILGMLLANLIPLPPVFAKGIGFCEKKVLNWAIALLGFSLNYGVLLALGMLPLAAILLGVPMTITAAVVWGRILGADRSLSLLVGIGNGVCGSSAIAAAQGVIKAREDQVGLSIGVINFLGTLGIFLLPGLSSLLPFLTPETSGVVIGNTLQAVGQVTAAGFSLGEIAGQTATVVKMGRILLLTPLILLLTFFKERKSDEKNLKLSLPRIPPFIPAFILFSLINTLGTVPPVLGEAVGGLSKILLVVAMAGIGMKIRFRDLASEGRQALLLGILVWLTQISLTLLLTGLFRFISL